MMIAKPKSIVCMATLLVITVVFGGCVELISWSPDGRYVAFCPGGPILLWDSKQEEVRTLYGEENSGKDDRAATTCMFMPLGRKVLAGINAEKDLNLVLIDIKSGDRKLLLEQVEVGCYSVSANGEYLFYVRKNDQQYEVRQLKLWHPSQDSLIYTSSDEVRFPMPNADASRLLISHESGVSVLDVKSGELETLVKDAGGGCFWPKWLDSNRVMYLLDEKDSEEFSLHVYNIEARSNHTFGADYEPVPPTLHPDHKQVILNDEQGLVWVDLILGKRERVTAKDTLGGYPAYSPDGKRLAFFVFENEDKEELQNLTVMDMTTRETKVVWKTEDEEKE